MKVTEHFKERLDERFGYNIETLWMDVEKKPNEMRKLVKNSKELDWYPHLKNTFKKHPDSMLILIEKLNLCMVSDNQILKTCYWIN